MAVLLTMGEVTSSERLVQPLDDDGVVSGSRWRESGIMRDFGRD